MSGAIIPAPLPMPATVTRRPPILTTAFATLGNASVVMIARANRHRPSGLASPIARSIPAVSFAIGSDTPMIPVDDAATSSGAIPSEAAAMAQAACASACPWSPVQAFALPLFTTSACRRPRRIRSRPSRTGAAQNRLRVNTAPAAAGCSASRTAQSGAPLFLIPQATPPKRKPGTRISSSTTSCFTAGPPPASRTPPADRAAPRSSGSRSPRATSPPRGCDSVRSRLRRRPVKRAARRRCARGPRPSRSMVGNGATTSQARSRPARAARSRPYATRSASSCVAELPRNPAVAALDGAPNVAARVAADPDGRVRTPVRSRLEDHVMKCEPPSREGRLPPRSRGPSGRRCTRR